MLHRISDGLPPDHVERLARAVILVAGILIPEEMQAAGLARVIVGWEAEWNRLRTGGDGGRHEC